MPERQILKKIFFSLSILVLLLIFLALPATSLAAPLKLNIILEKSYFTTTETINFKATVLNSSLNTKKRNRISLTIYDRLFYEEDINNFKIKRKKALFRHYWYKQIKPGKNEFSYKKDLAKIRLAQGVYPIRFRLELSNNQVITKNSFLVLIDKKERPLPVALVWDWGEPPIIDNNSNAYKRSWENRFGTAQKPGLYYRYLNKINQFPNLKFNIAATPLMLEELKSTSEKDEIKKLEKVKKVAENGQAPTPTPTLLDKLKKIVADKNRIELMPAPYSYPSLPFLAFQDWSQDIDKQLMMGKKTIRNTIDENYEYKGVFAPSMDLDTSSAERLSAAGAKYSIVGENTISGRTSIFAPRLLRLENGRSLTAFIADNEFNKILKETSEKELRLKLSAFFAKRFFDSEKNSGTMVVALTSDNSNRLPPEKLEKLFRFIDETPWLQSSKLNDLYQNASPAPGRLKKWRPGKKFDNSYIKKLMMARSKTNDFNISVSVKNPIRRSLENKLLIAENIYWLRQEAHNRSVSKKYLRDIDETIGLIFGNLKISARQNITFSSKKGKIPIAITNNNDYPLRITLKFEGDKEFIFNDDKIKRITIMPKNNLIVYRVEAKYTGKSNMDITLYSGKRFIAKEKLTVVISDTTKYILRIISVLSLVLIAALIFRKKRRA